MVSGGAQILLGAAALRHNGTELCAVGVTFSLVWRPSLILARFSRGSFSCAGGHYKVALVR